MQIAVLAVVMSRIDGGTRRSSTDNRFYSETCYATVAVTRTKTGASPFEALTHTPNKVYIYI